MPRPIERIIAATDLSEASRLALVRAGSIARDHGANLEILHVARPGSVLPPWLASTLPAFGSEASLEAELRGRLTAMAVDAGLGDLAAPAVEVRFGKAAQAIAERASQSHADLLVVGAHGDSGMLDLLVGSTAQRLLRISEVPTLVVRGEATESYRNVVAATDFSAPSAAALAFARRLAPAARFQLLHAYDVPYFTLMTHAGVSDDAMGDYRKLAHADATAEMAAFIDSLATEHRQVSTHLRHGFAPSVVRRFVQEHACDLIAIGAEGKGALGAALLGSVSSRVLAESPCDVLVTRGSDHI